MKFEVQLFYMDGKDEELLVSGDKVEKFLDDLGKNVVYYDEEKGQGIWIPIDKIRYFKIKQIDNGE